MVGEREREEWEEEKGRGGGRSTNSLGLSQNSSQKMHKKPAYHHPYYSSSMVDTFTFTMYQSGELFHFTDGKI